MKAGRVIVTLLAPSLIVLGCSSLRTDPIVSGQAPADARGDGVSPKPGARDADADSPAEAGAPAPTGTDGPAPPTGTDGPAPPAGADAARPPDQDARLSADGPAPAPDAGCPATTRLCADRCIASTACCTDGECAGFACVADACSTTVCAADHDRCGSTCIPKGRCCPAPGGRDCRSPLDNDCDGRPDNTIDQVCQCAPGASRACNAHPGADGVGPCRAGSQTCAAGPTPGTSSWGPCAGDVAPQPDDCAADGPDRDCNGMKGDGPTCTRTVYLYGSQPFTCGSPATDWPADIMLIDEDDPAGVPNGYRLISQFRIFSQGGGTKTALFRCFNPTDNYHFTGYSGCAGGPTQRQLGFVSTIDGGPGWTRLGELFGRNFGPTAALRSDVPECCAPACSPGSFYILK